MRERESEEEKFLLKTYQSIYDIRARKRVKKLMERRENDLRLFRRSKVGLVKRDARIL